MSNEQYCLRWNDHRVTLLNNFERLLQNNTSVDCTLAAEGQFLKAHKVVLSACSPYLEALLNQDKEKHPIIFMKDMKFQELNAILLYMYRGEVVIPHDNLAALLHAAESLQIKGLGCGERREAQKQQQSQKQQKSQQPPPPPPPPPPPVQPPRSAPVRGSLEIPPQIVDLTDERSQTPAPALVRAAQEIAKRSMPQDTGGRYKRASYPPNTPDRFIQSNIPLAAPRQRAVASPQGTIPLNTSQATLSSFTIQNTAATSPNGATFATNQAFMVQRPLTDAVVHNEYTAPRAMTQPVYTEAQVSRATAGQQMPHVPKVRQRRVVQSASRTVSGQPGSPAGLVLQQGSPVVGATKVATTCAELVTHTVAPTLVPALAPTLGPALAPTLVPALAPTLAPTLASAIAPTLVPASVSGGIVERTDVEPPALNAGEQMESAGSALPTQDTESSQELLSESGEMRDADLSKSLSENEVPGGVVDPATDNPGPSDDAHVMRSGRRGRPPASRPSDRRFQCPECDRKFSAKCSLEKHRRVHRDDCYKCDVCDKSFVARAGLIKHLRQHAPGQTASPKGQHKCRLCGASCADASELEKHLTDHSMSAAEKDKDEDDEGDV